MTNQKGEKERKKERKKCGRSASNENDVSILEMRSSLFNTCS